MPRAALLTTVLLAAALLASDSAGGQQEPPGDPVDASGMRIPAWQVSPELSEVWRRFTGRYIFQRACTSCHGWGPSRLTRAEWESYLADFPGNHDPDVRAEYNDLTAQFRPGRMVPNTDQRHDALATFLLAEPPSQTVANDEQPWDALPRVGDPVPEFTIVDLEGREHSPASYRGERRLVLVLSRAHW